MTASSLHTSDIPVAGGGDEAELSRIASRNRLVIGLLLVSAFVVILNETVLGVAQTRLEHELGVPYSLIQWLTTGFMLTMAVVIPITGFLLERFTTRAIFITAMSLFSAGTLICAVSPGFEMLLGGRIVQATGTAIMMPLLMTTVMNLVPPSARGRTMGNISIVISVAPAIGPTISGLILNVLEWRWLFFLVLPIAVGGLILGIARIENVTESRKVPVDTVSVILSALGFGGLIFGLSSIGEAARGAATVPLWIPIGFGILSLFVFVLRQRALQREERALLDLRTFLSPVFSVATGMLVLSMIAMFGMVVVLPIYMQDVLLLSPLTTGLLLLPGGLLMGFMAPFVGRFYDRFGPRPLVIPGSVIVSAALWGMTLLGANTPFMWVLVAHVGLSIGLALLFTPLFTSALGSLRPSLYSHGSAIVGTVQQLAGAAGTALFISVMTAGSIALARDGAGEIAAIAGGINSAFFYGACVSLLAIVAAFFVRKPADMPDGVPVGH